MAHVVRWCGRASSKGTSSRSTWQKRPKRNHVTRAKVEQEEDEALGKLRGTPIPPPPAEPDAPPKWTQGGPTEPMHGRHRVFCNRSLNMRAVKTVGFDMDYTLAQYRPDTFETLAYHETCKKLVGCMGYPQEISQFKFDWSYMVRGLTIDKKRGNVLKMDRHKYVKLAFHGLKQLSPEDLSNLYDSSIVRESFDGQEYAMIDTLFSLSEAYLFAQLVDLKDEGKYPVLEQKSYMKIYDDVRGAVDLCHRDGTLKQNVAKDPSKYIYQDENLVPLLQMLRKTGRSVFIVTNSLWDYTNVVMNYLLCGRVGKEKNLDWLQYFDVVITGSAKPAFFQTDSRSPLFEVDLKTGYLMNTDNGTPMTPIGAPDSMDDTGDLGIFGDGGKTNNHTAKDQELCRVFQGGNFRHLHRLLDIPSGSQVLYIGDHIYGDILSSKKGMGWRTMLVVPELAFEVEVLEREKDTPETLRKIRKERDLLDDRIHKLEWQLHAAEADSTRNLDSPGTEKELEGLYRQKVHLKRMHSEGLKQYHQNFHPIWGQLMKTGVQNSRFASQVERFACLYTSHLANLTSYSPSKSYKALEDMMPNDFP